MEAGNLTVAQILEPNCIRLVQPSQKDEHSANDFFQVLATSTETNVHQKTGV